jgi:uncharacterized delta-60 repeat protein
MILVSGTFAGGEGDPFSNLLVLDSSGRLFRRLPPVLHFDQSSGTELSQYRRCAFALDDGSFIVEKPTGDIVPGYFPWGAIQPLHLRADGTLDESFTRRFGSNGPVFQIAVQRDGKLLFSGAFGGVPIRRTFPDGTPDPEFRQQIASAGLPPVGSALALNPDGKIWLWPSDFNGSNTFTFRQLVRLNSDGSRDQGFSPPSFTNTGTLHAQADGKLLIKCQGRLSTPLLASDTNRIVMVRLNADGSVDTGFNVDPDVLAEGLSLFPTSVGPVALMPGGQIAVSVNHWYGKIRESIKRLLPDGRLDPTFKDQLQAKWLIDLIAQPDGKLLVLYTNHPFSCCDSNHLARLNQDGGLDASFDASVTSQNYLTDVEVTVAVAASLTGFRYALEATSDFRAWTAISGLIQFGPDGDFAYTFSDRAAASMRHRFYRLVEIAP